MPTPSEQKALAFVAIVILLGGAVRVVRAGAARPPTPFEQQALARQATATDSAAAAARQSKPAKRGRVTLRASRDTVPKVVGGVATVPLNRLGFPPPGPTISTEAGGAPRDVRRLSGTGSLVNLDVASAQEIERLPRICAALAARIVANRDSLGPFGSLERLERVKGIGKATRKLLAPLVTFGPARGPPNR